jgi:hypothetical protein
MIESSGVSPMMETIMKKGQQIRLKRSSRAAQEWNVPNGAEGTVICHYRLFAGGPSASDRLDVRFSARTIVWGAPATEFELIAEGPEAPG